MTKFQRMVSGTLTKAGLDTIGLGNAARALSNELQFVWTNIDKIPGIDPATIASVQEMKTEVEQFRNTIHTLVADGMALFSQFGKSLGMVAAAITQTFQKINLTDLFTNPSMVAAQFAVSLQDVDSALRAEFDSAVKAAQAQNQLADSTARTTVAKKEAASMLQLITKQNEEFARLEAARLQQMRAEGETIRREVLTPQEQWAESLVRLNDLLGAGAINQETFNRAMRNADHKLKSDEAKDSADRMDALTKKVFGPADEMIDKSDATVGNVSLAWERLGDDMAESMSRALLGMRGGFEDFGDFAKGIAQDLLAELLRAEIQAGVMRPLLASLRGAGGGFFGSALGGIGKIFGFADGGRPPLGQPSLVGERGPELFVPDRAGTIIPNHALKGASSVGTKNFYIDARGADREGLARLEAMIMAINGSIERRAVSAVADFRSRRASYA